MSQFVSPDDIINGGWAEEILLLQSQFFSCIGAIVRVQNTGDVLSILSFVNGSMVITWVELIEIESVSWSGSPKSQVVGIIGVESWDWGIVSNCNNLLTTFPSCSLGGSILVLLRVTIESNLVLDILSLNLPWVSVIKPKIWNFDLVTISNNLLENSVLISDTISPCWNLEGCKRVNKACCESSKTSVTESSICLLLVKFFKVVTHVHESFLERSLQVWVDKGILESPTHQELQGEVVYSLAVVVLVVLLGIVPRLE